MQLCRIDRRRLIRKGLTASEYLTVNQESGSWFNDYMKRNPTIVNHKKDTI